MSAFQRGWRTFLQTFVGSVAALYAASGIFGASGAIDTSAIQRFGIGVAAALISGLIAWAVNASSTPTP